MNKAYILHIASIWLSFSLAAMVDWTYSGAKGPQNWADINVAYRMCKTGTEQSPVLLNTCATRNNKGLSIFYTTTHLSYGDKNNSLTFTPDQKNNVIFEGQEYELLEIILRAHSEHYIDDRSFPIEIQFMHKNKLQEVLIIGVLVKIGKSNDNLDKLFNSLNLTISTKTPAIDLAELLPAEKEYFYYMGSLTYPPCSENVRWVVFREAISTSKENIEAFTKKYANNFRPVQNFNQRKFIEVK